ncbi:diguanylate cyclase [Marinobacterium arenosum]|uniref:diguanylate cyclase n=1 Tax=Marinobacterium arenosum TaxID=2862496 RepID=UPI001C9581A7|nr:transporter substrate-binding domain-containing protein [Marinobacterium arenosum]MBY4676948.1 transporter substrate-binding domain-containing protein [Marinobacterium arenosum]
MAEFSLTDAERQYLRSRGPITYCIDPDWMPFEKIDRRGRHIGISADFMAEFSRMLGVPLHLVATGSWAESMERARNRECDLLSLANESAERRKHFDFTDPYLVLPVVLIATKDSPYLDGLKKLEGKTISVPEGYVLVEFMQQTYPGVQLHFTQSLLEALREVARGDVQAAIAGLPTALYQIQQQGLSQLKIAGNTEFNYELSVAVRNDQPLLHGIFQKAVNELSPALRDRILERWYNVKVEQARDYTLLLILLAGLLVALAFLIYRNHSSQKFNAQLAKMNDRLTDRNQRLEQVSKRDFLTGTYNRVKIDRELQDDFARHRKHGKPLSLILFDLDGLSEVNLSHDHQVGDLVIVETCRLVEESLGEWHQLGRWEGDLFLVLCPDTPLEDALGLAKKLNTLLQLHHFSEDVHISASFCVAQCDNKQNHAELIRRMEQCLIASRQQGPHQVATLVAGTAEQED